jgi:anti-sigma regulatory factor (Ser/Thr protein kinase)
MRVVRAAMEKLCEMVGLDDADTGAVVLSVDEALANIIRHVYKNAEDQRIDIEVVVADCPEGGSLQIRVRDYGQYVDPEQIRSRDLEDIRPGGLGVHIMTECMDSVEYRPAEGGGTLLVLSKALPRPSDGVSQ